MEDNNILDNAAKKEAKEIYDSYHEICSGHFEFEYGSELGIKECAIECVNRLIASCHTTAKIYYEEVKIQIENI